jgi:hypothetical protein
VGGCGGGGGGSSSPPPAPPPPGPTVTGIGFAPTSGPGDTSAYYPLAAGNQRLFDSTPTDPTALAPAGAVTIAVNGTKTVLGATATVITRTDPTSAAGGYDGTVSTVTGKNVPAGSFINALKQTTTVTATATDGGQSIPISGTDLSWQAPGVGPIKDLASATSNGVTITSDSALRFYTVKGQKHGIGASSALAASLVGANCQAVAQALPSVTSDGTNFLVVAYACDASSGSAMANWVGTLVGSDGAVITKFHITAPTVATGPRRPAWPHG